jgi:flagellar biosynthesis GTPase FlhF
MHWTMIFLSPAYFRQKVPARLITLALLLATLGSASLWADKQKKERKEDYGLGLTTVIEAPESEVLEAVQAVVGNGIIQGSKEYERDPYIDKADPATSSTLFPAWTEPGKVFYKVRTEVLDPRGFYESNDIGTLAVRYVVQVKDAAHTLVRIDAIFEEDFRRFQHASDGSVEAAEFKDIQDHIDATEEQKRQAAQSEKHREEEIARKAMEEKAEMAEIESLSSSENSEQALEEKVKQLRRKAERLTKVPGAQLRSAPFHTASVLKNLDPGLEVVILVKTSYWMGVETEDGQHGWIRQDQLEPMP